MNRGYLGLWIKEVIEITPTRDLIGEVTLLGAPFSLSLNKCRTQPSARSQSSPGTDTNRAIALPPPNTHPTSCNLCWKREWLLAATLGHRRTSRCDSNHWHAELGPVAFI